MFPTLLMVGWQLCRAAMQHDRYAFLDGIRGLAAIAILTRHTGEFWHFKLYRSYLAVDLFFVLSGFVIAHAYDQRLRDGALSVPRFLLVRLIRLYPMYLLSVLFAGALLVTGIDTDHPGHIGLGEMLGVIALTALYLPSRLSGDEPQLFPLNGPYWSLMFELIANACYAVLRPLLTDRLLAAVVIVFGILVIAVTHHDGRLAAGYLWGYESVVAGFVRAIFGIFLGLLLHRHHARFGRGLARRGLAWLAVLAVAGVLILPRVAHGNWAIDALSATVLFPLIVLLAAQGQSVRWERALLRLGAASYPIYVLHEPMGKLVQALVGRPIDRLAPLSGVLLVALMIALATWLERAYDVPLRRWLSQLALQPAPRRVSKPA